MIKSAKLEQELFAEVLPNIFGYHLLQLDFAEHFDFAASSQIKSKIFASEKFNKNSNVCCNFTELPFLPNSIDVVLMPHILENMDDPLAVLNEVYHILLPGGQVIITGYNPVGFFGIRCWRLRKMLKSFDFKILEIKKIGKIYLVVAKKNMASLVPMHKKSVKITKQIINHCARPTSRVIEHEKS